MSKALRFSVKFLALVALVAVAQALVAPAAPAHHPYASALSTVSVGTAYAAPINCPNNSCGGKKTCRADHGFYCTVSNGVCSTSKCI